MNDMNFVLKAFFDTHHIVAQLDVESGEIVFYKDISFHLQLNTPYQVSELSKILIQSGYLSGDDNLKFNYYANLQNLMEFCLQNQSAVLFSYKLHLQDSVKWSRLFLSVPDEFYHTDSKKVLLYQRELPSIESDFEISIESWTNRFLKIIKFNASTNEATTLKERSHEILQREEYYKKNLSKEKWNFEKDLIYKDDLPRFLDSISFDHIEEELRSEKANYFFYYRRKIRNMYKWVRLTIIKSNDYNKQNPVFLLYVENVHQVLADIFDKQGLLQYKKLSLSDENADAYYQNATSILSYFTEKYLDFFMIDLQKNLYILYKINPALLDGSISYIGNFSDLSNRILNNIDDEKDRQALSSLLNIDQLKSLLNTRASIEAIHSSGKKQKVKSVVTKIESVSGIPTKAIWRTSYYISDKQLTVKTFGNFHVFDEEGHELKFTKKQSKQLLAYLIDKQGYPSSTRDIVVDVLEKEPGDLNAVKYVSTLTRLLIKDLKAYGYVNIIVKEYNTVRINTNRIDCDYYHLLNGDNSYWSSYHNEYMKEYSWAEATNAEILQFFNF